MTFTKKSDVFASAITNNIATNIEKISGEKPYTEIVISDRKYVDHNREKKCAFDKLSIIAMQAYRDYHN